MRAAAHLAADQASALQDLNVLRGRRKRHGEGFRELADRSLAERARAVCAGASCRSARERWDLSREVAISTMWLNIPTAISKSQLIG